MAIRSKSLHDRAVINCQYSVAAFSSGERRARSKSDRRSLEISRTIKETFEAAILTEFAAKSQIDIYVQILQSDGGEFGSQLFVTELYVLSVSESFMVE